MKTIVISDIHGCYNELKELLFELETSGEYNKNTDKLVFLGDYIDRGEDSRKVIELVRSLQENNDNVIALMGNHEDMMLDYYRNGERNWLFNGGYNTIDSYHGFDKQLEDDMMWIRTLPLYHEDEHFIYVHAGVDVYKPIEEQDKETLLWIREPFIYTTKEYHKTVVFGHTPTLTLNDISKPVYTFAYNIDIDTGCVFGGALTALIIEDDEVNGFYQVCKEVKPSDKKNEKVNS